MGRWEPQCPRGPVPTNFVTYLQQFSASKVQLLLCLISISFHLFADKPGPKDVKWDNVFPTSAEHCKSPYPILSIQCQSCWFRNKIRKGVWFANNGTLPGIFRSNISMSSFWTAENVSVIKKLFSHQNFYVFSQLFHSDCLWLLGR